MRMTMEVDDLVAAANASPTVFRALPDHPVHVRCASALTGRESTEILARFRRHGFVVVELGTSPATPETLLDLAQSLNLGPPFIPPLYGSAGHRGSAVARIAASADTDPAHPSFERAVGLEFHCDGTLQQIGVVKTAILLCEAPGAAGGETTLFNAAAAYAELLVSDPDAAVELAAPEALIRQANINGCTDSNIGPAFAVQTGRLLCGYSVTDTDRWNPPDGVRGESFARAVAYLQAAAKPGSPYYVQFKLRARQALVLDNTRLSHGRTRYTDSSERHRCLFRGVYLRYPGMAQGSEVADRFVQHSARERGDTNDSPRDLLTGPPPPFDRELAGPLRHVLSKLPWPLTPELIAKGRELTERASLSDDQIRRGGVFDLTQVDIPCSEGCLSVLICRPTTGHPPHPTIYHIHGGGMVAGNNRSAELSEELERALQLQMAVVAINYRLAPEHPDPTPVEDCYAGLTWLAEHGAEFGLDTSRIIISGNSAGGGLSAGVSLLVRDRRGPPLLGQMLQCPMLDDRCDTPSSHQMHAVGVWDGRSNMTGWNALLGSRRGSQDVSCYAAPARAKDLSQLPPTFIDVGSAEALRDEALDYAARIWRAGGQAELHVWPGGFHSFDQWVPEAAMSQAAKSMRIAWMQRLLSRTLIVV